MAISSLGTNITVSCLLLVMFSVTLFLMNFNCSMSVTCSHLSNIFTMAIPEISSTKRASTVMYFYSFGLSIICSLNKNGTDMFRKLK